MSGLSLFPSDFLGGSGHNWRKSPHDGGCAGNCQGGSAFGAERLDVFGIDLACSFDDLL